MPLAFPQVGAIERSTPWLPINLWNCESHGCCKGRRVCDVVQRCCAVKAADPAVSFDDCNISESAVDGPILQKVALFQISGWYKNFTSAGHGGYVFHLRAT